MSTVISLLVLFIMFDIAVNGRASHAAVVQDSTMWVYGGYSFNDKSNDLLR